MSAQEVGAGAIWEFQMDFEDTGKRKKYVVLLNTCVDHEDFFVAALTTSRAYQYRDFGPKQCGCPENSCYRIDPGQVACFTVTTYVQFNNTGRLRFTDLRAKVAAGSAKYLLSLPQERLFSVMNCALKSVDLAGDMHVRVEKTLKSLEEVRKKERAAAKVSAKPLPHAAMPALVVNRLTPNFVRAELTKYGKTPDYFCDVLGIPVQEFEDFDKRPDGPPDQDIQAALDICREQ